MIMNLWMELFQALVRRYKDEYKAMPQVLLPASSILQLSSVREACCKFLMRQLHPTNCLGIRNFADTHACKELHKRSHKFALENFQEVMNTEEFLLLPFQEVSR